MIDAIANVIIYIIYALLCIFIILRIKEKILDFIDDKKLRCQRCENNFNRRIKELKTEIEEIKFKNATAQEAYERNLDIIKTVCLHPEKADEEIQCISDQIENLDKELKLLLKALNRAKNETDYFMDKFFNVNEYL